MKATELRIGNLIGLNLKDHPENILVVMEVAEFNMKVSSDIEKKSEPFYIDCDITEGIPLSEEWLTRSGFKRNPHHSDSTWVRGSKVICFINNEVLMYNMSAKKYVHEFQNLHYALSNEELLK